MLRGTEQCNSPKPDQPQGHGQAGVLSTKLTALKVTIKNCRCLFDLWLDSKGNLSTEHGVYTSGSRGKDEEINNNELVVTTAENEPKRVENSEKVTDSDQSHTIQTGKTDSETPNGETVATAKVHANTDSSPSHDPVDPCPNLHNTAFMDIDTDESDFIAVVTDEWHETASAADTTEYELLDILSDSACQSSPPGTPCDRTLTPGTPHISGVRMRTLGGTQSETHHSETCKTPEADQNISATVSHMLNLCEARENMLTVDTIGETESTEAMLETIAQTTETAVLVLDTIPAVSYCLAQETSVSSLSAAVTTTTNIVHQGMLSNTSTSTSPSVPLPTTDETPELNSCSKVEHQTTPQEGHPPTETPPHDDSNQQVPDHVFEQISQTLDLIFDSVSDDPEHAEDEPGASPTDNTKDNITTQSMMSVSSATSPAVSGHDGMELEVSDLVLPDVNDADTHVEPPPVPRTDIPHIGDVSMASAGVSQLDLDDVSMTSVLLLGHTSQSEDISMASTGQASLTADSIVESLLHGVPHTETPSSLENPVVPNSETELVQGVTTVEASTASSETTQESPLPQTVALPNSGTQDLPANIIQGSATDASPVLGSSSTPVLQGVADVNNVDSVKHVNNSNNNVISDPVNDDINSNVQCSNKSDMLEAIDDKTVNNDDDTVCDVQKAAQDNVPISTHDSITNVTAVSSNTLPVLPVAVPPITSVVNTDAAVASTVAVTPSGSVLSIANVLGVSEKYLTTSTSTTAIPPNIAAIPMIPTTNSQSGQVPATATATSTCTSTAAEKTLQSGTVQPKTKPATKKKKKPKVPWVVPTIPLEPLADGLFDPRVIRCSDTAPSKTVDLLLLNWSPEKEPKSETVAPPGEPQQNQERKHKDQEEGAPKKRRRFRKVPVEIPLERSGDVQLEDPRLEFYSARGQAVGTTSEQDNDIKDQAQDQDPAQDNELTEDQDAEHSKDNDLGHDNENSQDNYQESVEMSISSVSSPLGGAIIGCDLSERSTPSPFTQPQQFWNTVPPPAMPTTCGMPIPLVNNYRCPWPPYPIPHYNMPFYQQEVNNMPGLPLGTANTIPSLVSSIPVPMMPGNAYQPLYVDTGTTVNTQAGNSNLNFNTESQSPPPLPPTPSQPPLPPAELQLYTPSSPTAAQSPMIPTNPSDNPALSTAINDMLSMLRQQTHSPKQTGVHLPSIPDISQMLDDVSNNPATSTASQVEKMDKILQLVQTTSDQNSPDQIEDLLTAVSKVLELVTTEPKEGNTSPRGTTYTDSPSHDVSSPRRRRHLSSSDDERFSRTRIQRSLPNDLHMPPLPPNSPPSSVGSPLISLSSQVQSNLAVQNSEDSASAYCILGDFIAISSDTEDEDTEDSSRGRHGKKRRYTKYENEREGYRGSSSSRSRSTSRRSSPQRGGKRRMTSTEPRQWDTDSRPSSRQSEHGSQFSSFTSTRSRSPARRTDRNTCKVREDLRIIKNAKSRAATAAEIAVLDERKVQLNSRSRSQKSAERKSVQARLGPAHPYSLYKEAQHRWESTQAYKHSHERKAVLNDRDRSRSPVKCPSTDVYDRLGSSKRKSVKDRTRSRSPIKCSQQSDVYDRLGRRPAVHERLGGGNVHSRLGGADPERSPIDVYDLEDIPLPDGRPPSRSSSTHSHRSGGYTDSHRDTDYRDSHRGSSGYLDRDYRDSHRGGGGSHRSRGYVEKGEGERLRHSAHSRLRRNNYRDPDGYDDDWADLNSNCDSWGT